MPRKIIFTNKELDTMYKMHYEECKNATQIAKAFNVTAKVIYRVFEENNWSKMTMDEIRQYKFDQFYFHDIDTPEKAYWLGFITADGFITKDGYGLRIKLGWRDNQHLNKFIKCIKGKSLKVKKQIHTITGNFIALLELNSRTMVEDLNALSVFNCKSGHEIFALPYDHPYIRDYIRGIWDGDGWISKNHFGCCGSYLILKSIQEVFDKYFDRKPTTIRFDSNIYKIDICGKKSLEIFEWIYYEGCLGLDRKKILVHKKLNNYWTKKE